MRSLRRCPVRTYLVRTGTYRSLGRSGRSSGAVSVRIVALLVLGFCCFQRTGLGQRTSLVFFRQTRWIRMHRSSRRLNCENYLHGDSVCIMERWWELLAFILGRPTVIYECHRRWSTEKHCRKLHYSSATMWDHERGNISWLRATKNKSVRTIVCNVSC